jgi:hypothetical protein
MLPERPLKLVHTVARSVVRPTASLPIERPGRRVDVRADDLGIEDVVGPEHRSQPDNRPRYGGLSS